MIRLQLAPVTEEGFARSQTSVSESYHQQVSKTEKIQKIIKELEEICNSMEENSWENIDVIKRKFYHIQMKIKENNLIEVRDINIYGILKKQLHNFQNQTNLETLVESHKEKLRLFTLNKLGEDQFQNETDFYNLDCEELEESKLVDHTLLVYPSASMRGYIPFPWGKECYQEGYYDSKPLPDQLKKMSHIFEYCNYIQTVHQINQLFFQPFDKEKPNLAYSIIQKIIVLAGVVMLVCILFGIFTSQIIGFVTVGCFAIPCLSHSISVIKTTYQYSIKDSQMQIRAKRIEDFFKKRNEETKNNPNIIYKFEWVINNNKKWKNPLLFLELKFTNGFPPVYAFCDDPN